MIRIRLPDTTVATLEAHRWHCENRRIETLLNAMLAPWERRACPEADLYEARVVTKVLDAEIIDSHPYRHSDYLS